MIQQLATMIPLVPLIVIMPTLPLILFLWSKRFKVVNTEPENKGQGHDLVVLECYMVELTNALNDQRGKPHIEHLPVIAGFGGVQWEAVRVRCRQTALGCVRKISWIKEVMS